MPYTLIRTSLVVLALVALPVGLSAQWKTPPQQTGAASAAAAPTAAQKEMQAWYAELQEIGAKLMEAQRKALQDPRLRSMQESLAKEFKAAMLKADPSLAGLEERAKALEEEARKAQQARDEATFRKLAEEARQIELKLMEAQKKVMQNPGFAARAQAFEQAMQKKMVEVEPQTMALIERGKVLQAKLTQAARAQRR